MAIGTGAALLGGAAISGVSSILGGNQAADAVSDASAQSNALQRYIYDQNRTDQAPYRNIGTQALQALGSLYGFGINTNPAASQQPAQPAQDYGANWKNVIAGRNALAPAPAQPTQPGGQPGNFDAFFTSPDYQFRFDQGLQALDRSAAARGRLYSGAQIKAATNYGQQAGSQEFGNYFNRLSSLAGIGQTATNQLGQYGQNYANQVGQNYMNAGNAQASAYMNRGNALSGFIGDAAYGYGRGLFGGP